jgi:hypothetical protein
LSFLRVALPGRERRSPAGVPDVLTGSSHGVSNGEYTHRTTGLQDARNLALNG